MATKPKNSDLSDFQVEIIKARKDADLASQKLVLKIDDLTVKLNTLVEEFVPTSAKSLASLKDLTSKYSEIELDFNSKLDTLEAKKKALESDIEALEGKFKEQYSEEAQKLNVQLSDLKAEHKIKLNEEKSNLLNSINQNASDAFKRFLSERNLKVLDVNEYNELFSYKKSSTEEIEERIISTVNERVQNEKQNIAIRENAELSSIKNANMLLEQKVLFLDDKIKSQLNEIERLNSLVQSMQDSRAKELAAISGANQTTNQK